MPLDSLLSQVTGGINLKSISLEAVCEMVILAVVGIIVIKLLMKLLDRLLDRSPALSDIRGYLRSTIHVVLWLLLALVVLGSLGVQLTSIIALLSVAGLAISLALQNTLSNLASGIMILVSKPFSIGDYVEIDSISGTVSSVGLVYSTLVNVENKEIYIPNSQVSNTKITNYTRLGRRRMELTFTASYDAPTDTVKAALQEALDQFPQILTDPAPAIWLSEYGDSSISYIIRAWTTTDDYWDVYYRLMEAVRPAFERHNVEMTYNHLNVHLVNSKS